MGQGEQQTRECRIPKENQMSLNCCAMTGVKSQDRVVRRKVRRIFKAKQIEKNTKKSCDFAWGQS